MVSHGVVWTYSTLYGYGYLKNEVKDKYVPGRV